MAKNSVMQISPFMTMMIGLLFTFSTFYGLMYYYYIGEAQTVQFVPLDSNSKNVTTELSDSGGFLSGFVTGALNSALSLIASISPFELIRGAISVVTPTELFTPIDIFLLRPMSWVVFIISANWVLALIRGKSEGT